MTIGEAIKLGTNRLIEADVPDASHDAGELLRNVLGIPEYKLLGSLGDELSEEKAYFHAIERRAGRVPLQHITGVQEFMGLPISVDERVLCPRLDTETLATKVFDIIDGIYKNGGLFPTDNVVPIRHDLYFDREVRLLDMCTGSGCVAISAAHHGKQRGYNLKVTAVDASADALDVARMNAKNNGVDISFLQGDLYEPLFGESFYVITANPPYIPSEVIPRLMPEVRDHEPHIALDGGEDGLLYYHRITEDAHRYLVSGGWLLYEIGFNQGQDVYAIMEDAGFLDIQIIKDLAGDDRVVCGHL